VTPLEPLPLGTAWLGRPHLHLAACASTNDRAAAEGRAGAAEGLLVTTDEQLIATVLDIFLGGLETVEG